MLPKPSTCTGCPLEDRGRGYAPACGPASSPLLFIGEALGYEEALHGEPFVGAAGGMLNRLLARNHWDRSSFRIDNLVRCQPPSNWLDGAPYQWGAIQHCTANHLSATLKEPHHVLVTLGGLPLRTILGLTGKGIKVQDFHGTVHQLPSGQYVVPTFHPSFLQRGATHLFGTVSFDLQVAERVARLGRPPDPATVVCDPTVEWFQSWADQVCQAAAHDPQNLWLAVDLETPDTASRTDEGELTAEDRSYIIVRVNLSVHPDEGVTVPYQGPYIAILDKLLRLPCPHLFWNKEYDQPRLEAAGHVLAGDCWDFMWAWHHLQSDLPRGLGFVAPFYSGFGAWKHLSDSDPVYYAAIDGFQTYRVAAGIATDLTQAGMWDCFARHTHALHQLALQPAQQIGVKIDRPRLEVFIEDLAVKQRRLLHAMQGMVPEEVRPLTPKNGYKQPPKEGVLHAKGTDLKRDGTQKKEAPDPIKQELYAQALIVHRTVRVSGYRCLACGATGVQRRHRCAGQGRDHARLQLDESDADRWFWQEPFNPDSPPQILAYLKLKGHKPGRAKHTGNDSTDRETLQRLFKETKDPLYKAILDCRAVGKVRGTYGLGTLKRLDKEDRIHPVPTFKPSTHRLSYNSPNITNVITDRGQEAGKENLATGFRACVVADAGCRLLEVDFSGIEAVLTGYFMRDPSYIRLAKLGVHAGLASHVLKRPYDTAWPDAQLAAYFKEIKATEDAVYNRAKRCVHGTNYGLTEYGMVRNFPDTFPTLKVAKSLIAHYHEMAPLLPKWQAQVRERAYAQNYLGGPGDHPFGYKHWFWAVLGFRPISHALYQQRIRHGQPVTVIQGKYFALVWGEDAKRAVAFYPQSTAAGVLKEVLLRLFDPDHPSYIGDAYYGRTPFRAPIHDSLLLEVPHRVWDQVLERVYREMLRPVQELPLEWIDPPERERLGLGAYLSIGVEAKVGNDWLNMSKLVSPTLEELGVSQDAVYFPPEDDDSEDEISLGTVA